jgi:hypothetical protein
MTDADVIAAIRSNHLKANIGWCERKRSVKLHWDRAWLDPGGTVFGDGPYVKLPITNYWGTGEETVHRVYAPARLLRRLRRHWSPPAADAVDDSPTK